MNAEKKAGERITFPRGMGIRRKMFLYFGIGAALILISINLISLFGLSFIGIKGSYQLHRSEVIQKIEQVADLKRGEISHWFEERIKHAKALSGYHRLNTVVTKARDGISKCKDKNVFLTGVRSLNEYRETSQYIQSIKSVFHEYEDIQIVDIKTGLIIFSTDEKNIGMVILEDEAIKNAGLPGVNEQVYFKKEKGKVGLHILHPITSGHQPGEEGRASLAALFIINPEKFLTPALHTGTGLGQSEEVMLVDMNRMILSPLKYPLPGNEKAAPLQYRVDSKPAELAVLGIDGVVYGEDYTGKPIIAAVKHIRVTSDFGLGMIVKINEEEIFTYVRQNMNQSLFISALGFFLILSLIYFFSGQVAHPIIRLRGVAEKVTEGDLSARASVKTEDEIGFLAASFNSMVEKIQKWNEELETKVRQRTSELSESEERYHLLFDNSIDAVLLTAPDGSIFRANPEACRVFGYTEEELRQFGRDRVVDKTDPRLPIALEERMQTGKFKGELNFVRSDGTKFPGELSSNVFKDSRGNVRTSMIIRDITERKRAEETMRESQARLELAIQASNIGLFDWDLRTNKVYFSPGWKKQIGYEVDEISNDFSEWQNRVHPADLGRMLNTVQSYIANPWDNYEVEFRFRHKDGSYRWILTRASLLMDDQGKPYRMLGSHLDITERKKMEEELRLSLELFSNAFNIGPAGMTITRIADGKFIDVNESFLNMFEYRREEIIGHTSTELNMWTPEERNKLIKQQIESGGLSNFELLARSKSGRPIHLLFSSKPMEVRGELCHITTMIDITERKRAEEQLRITSEQLRSLSARLQSIREEERTLIARELHDELGQALTGLKMDLSWLSRKIPNDQEVLFEKIDSMSKLIDTTIQTVRRISSELRPGILDDLGLIAAVEWLDRDFENRTGIKCEFHSSLEEIELDKDRSTAVFRILQETLTNVVRHAKATKVMILVEEEEGHFILKVSDNGVGIRERDILSPKSLGLLGIRERAHLFGGTVEFRGTKEGTTVEVRIPLKTKEEG